MRSNAARWRLEDHIDQIYLTPQEILLPVRIALGGRIDLDPCADPGNNVGARRFYAPPQDGVALPWFGADVQSVYVNPPYGRARQRWIDKCILEAARGASVVLLMPAHTDTKWVQKALCYADSIVFIAGRLRFGVYRESGKQATASHPSALFGFNCDLAATGLGWSST